MRRTFLFVGLTVAVLATGVAVLWPTGRSPAQPPTGENGRSGRVAAPTLPLAQVILFSSGVGYFQREGEIEGNTRIDLTFPATDVNDLLKSLVLQDTGNGKISTISYDSQEPVERTLKSFALDLTTNPSFGQLINQARGERVELTLAQGTNTQPATLSGVIIGMESQQEGPNKEIHLLNVLCTEGVRCLPLQQVQRLRFLNPALEADFRRALEVLAGSHDSLKKTVSLNFAGEGRRPVKVGYVVENPIWKTSYRLVLDKNGKGPFLQGWALVENTSDADWKDVRMALISGRPISFQMDLYQPLFIPRPTVEMDRFASLRPPTYGGAMVAGQITGPAAGGGAGAAYVPPNANLPMMTNGSINRYQLGVFNGTNQLGFQGGQFGQQGGINTWGMNANNDGTSNSLTNTMNFAPSRLSYQELQQRRQNLKEAKDKAAKVGSAVAALDPAGSVQSLASADEIGDYFQYTIDQKVSLPRQKSAMLPIVNQDVAGSRVSIYNEAVHAKFPLLGLKFKNTSGQNLMQGPVSVFDNGAYAGDARIPDLQPDEERLLSYAIDLGTEVKTETASTPQQLTAVKIVKGVVNATHRLRTTHTYLAKNRSNRERTLIVEHPIRTDWKLVAPTKATEQSRDFYRFELKVPAGQTVKHEVIEETSRRNLTALSSTDDQTVKLILSSTVAGNAVKEGFRKAVTLRQGLATTQKELADLERQLKAITEDQGRLRANIDKLPHTSAAYKRYLEKFDTQETQIEKLQGQIEQQREAVKRQQKEYDDYLAALTVE
jgi:hypothetical protein